MTPLFNRRDYSRAEAFWSPNYIQHSAHIAPGRTGLFDLVKSLPAELRYEPQLVVADGDHAILHGRFSNHGRPVNWIVADILRIVDGTLAEHWDVIQDEAEQTQSLSGLPMFGNMFPPGQRAARPPVERLAEESLLLQAVVAYLRGRPAGLDTTSTRNFNNGHAALEGIYSYPSTLGASPRSPWNRWSRPPSVPLCTTTGADTSADRHRIGTCRWPGRWRWPHRPECTSSVIVPAVWDEPMDSELERILIRRGWKLAGRQGGRVDSLDQYCWPDSYWDWTAQIPDGEGSLLTEIDAVIKDDGLVYNVYHVGPESHPSRRYRNRDDLLADIDDIEAYRYPQP